MSKRLSKIARELNVGISIIAEFLISNGFECEENPNMNLSEENYIFLKNNIYGYIKDQRKINLSQGQAKQPKKAEQQATEQVPLELKIIDAASKQKKLIERIIGFTDFDWHYTVIKFNGTCSQPVNFNLFDEVLCDLLLTKQMSAQEMGEILGLDIQTDPAEKEILLYAINELKKDNMIDGDESIYWLNDVGSEYAKKGVKFTTFKRDFDLYVDLSGGIKDNVSKIFSGLTSEKTIESSSEEYSQMSIEDIRELAEFQAPEIHYPQKQFILQEAQFIKSESFKAKVWVVLLENFRDNTIRAIVYDSKQDKIIDPLSDAFDKLEDEKMILLNKLVKVSENEDFAVEFTTEEKQEDQKFDEAELIQKQEEIETALDTQDIDKVKEIQKEISNIKRHFNSLEFEVELKRLFDHTANDLWIISPWIKKYATLRRIPFFEKYIQKGGRIFVAYSEPENEGDVMADEEALKKLLELEKTHLNFYICQLPKFHYKMVWLKHTQENDLYYNGSYNILSFFVKQGLQNVRQERMIKLNWDKEKENDYTEIFTNFGVKYLNRAVDDFNALSTNSPESIDKAFLQKVKSYDYGKIKPFINQGMENFDEKYQQLQDTKESNLQYFRQEYVKCELVKFKKEALKLSKQQQVPFGKKREIQERLNLMNAEFSEFSELSEYNEVMQIINNLKVFDFGKKAPNNQATNYYPKNNNRNFKNKKWR